MNKVLLIDDQPWWLQWAVECLMDSGFEVVVEINPKTAAKTITEGSRYRGIITDEVMPQMRGSLLVAYLEESGVELPPILHWSSEPYVAADKRCKCKQPEVLNDFIKQLHKKKEN